MKVIFSRIYNELANKGSAIQDRTSLLAWFLSVLKWKELGYETILYADETTQKAFKEYGLLSMYDEVKTLKNEEIDETIFWACSKILSAKQFMQEYPNEEFMISDLDFIPLKDPKDFAISDNDIVTFYGEYWKGYTELKYINFNPEYTLPAFYTGTVDPINTCLLYIQKNNLELFKKYLDIEQDFMSYHKKFISGQSSNDLMVFVEQRLFTEYLVSNDIPITFTSQKNKSVFNASGLHTGPYKSLEKTDYWKWNIWYLKWLKEEYPDVFECIISLELYKDIKDIIDNGNGTYVNAKGKETKIEEFDWNSLEYPRAFEDIYDENWNN